MNHSKTALITGASEGIGYELAKIMAADGWNLVLVARREALLSGLSAALIARHNVHCAVIPADFSRPFSASEVVDVLKTKHVHIDALINNAGFGYYGEFQSQELEKLESMVEVNISSLMRLTRLLLPPMIERKSGYILNVASTASFQAVPLNGVYAATKAFVLSFSEFLATELQSSGISVTCLCPGVTETGFQKAAGGKALPKRDFRGTMSAETVAMEGYRAMLARKRIAVTGTTNRLLVYGAKLAPRKMATEIAFGLMKKRK